MVQSDREKILADDLLGRKGKNSQVPTVAERPVSQRVQTQSLLYLWIDCYCCRGADGRGARHGAKLSSARRHRGNGVNRCNSLRLPDALVVPEDECPVFANWTASRSTKLVTLDRRNR